MSLFDDDNEDIKRSIQFFNQLPNNEKVRIVSDLNPQIFQQNAQYKPLIPLLARIQQDISKHDAIEIGNKLMEFGLDETYARLFVSNVKNHAPTEEYQLNQINKISDEDFCTNLPDIITDVWINRKPYTTLSEKYGIEPEKIRCVVDLVAHAFNNLALGTMTKDRLKKEYKPHLSEQKLNALINQIAIHNEHQYKTTIYGNVQDMFYNTDRIVLQNRAILRLLQELVDLKRKDSEHQKR